MNSLSPRFGDKSKGASHLLNSVCPFLLRCPKEMDVIRALFPPWALGLTYIRVRLEMGAAARSLSRQNYRAFLRNVCDSLRLLTSRFFANILFAFEATRWRFSYRLSIRLRRMIKGFFSHSSLSEVLCALWIFNYHSS